MNAEQAQAILHQTELLLASPSFRNFVSQAHSRNVLERMRADRTEWPPYTPTLDTSLLYVAHLLLWQGLQLRDVEGYRKSADHFITQGAEILEFVYSEADPAAGERTEQLFSVALGYYISGYYARAYVLMRDLGPDELLMPEYILLRRLFLKELPGMRRLILQILNEPTCYDKVIASSLLANQIDEDEAVDRILRASFHQAFSFFVEYPKNGRRDLLFRARQILNEGISLSQKTKLVDW